MRKELAERINGKCRDEWQSLITQWVHSERDRAMIIRYLLDGIPYEPLAEEFDLSTIQARTIVDKAIKQLFKHI